MGHMTIAQRNGIPKRAIACLAAALAVCVVITVSLSSTDKHDSPAEASSLAAAVPDPGQQTVTGCTCKSVCQASVNDLFACNWCRTTGSCGHTSWGTLGLAGKWDYCVGTPVTTSAEFESQTATDKDAYFWNKINADHTHGVYSSPGGLFKESVRTTFAPGDEMPNGRKKGIHGVGAICKFKLDIAASPYTGLLSAGSQHGFVRMGSAVGYENGGLTPGLGIKYNRDKVHSGNYVALNSLDFGQSWNFFKSVQSNHIPGASGLVQPILLKKFQQASQCPTMVGLSDLTAFSQDGTWAARPVTPFKLMHIPTDAVQTPDKEKTIDQVNAEMAAFPVGTPLYSVYACGAAAGDAENQPTAKGDRSNWQSVCRNPTKLGDMVTTTKCTASKYGDEKFYIKHQQIEDDWKQNPDLANQFDMKAVCGVSFWQGLKVDGAPDIQCRK